MENAKGKVGRTNNQRNGQLSRSTSVEIESASAVKCGLCCAVRKGNKFLKKKYAANRKMDKNVATEVPEHKDKETHQYRSNYVIDSTFRLIRQALDHIEMALARLNVKMGETSLSIEELKKTAKLKRRRIRTLLRRMKMVEGALDAKDERNTEVTRASYSVSDEMLSPRIPSSPIHKPKSKSEGAPQPTLLEQDHRDLNPTSSPKSRHNPKSDVPTVIKVNNVNVSSSRRSLPTSIVSPPEVPDWNSLAKTVTKQHSHNITERKSSSALSIASQYLADCTFSTESTSCTRCYKSAAVQTDSNYLTDATPSLHSHSGPSQVDTSCFVDPSAANLVGWSSCRNTIVTKTCKDHVEPSTHFGYSSEESNRSLKVNNELHKDPNVQHDRIEKSGNRLKGHGIIESQLYEHSTDLNVNNVCHRMIIVSSSDFENAEDIASLEFLSVHESCYAENVQDSPAASINDEYDNLVKPEFTVDDGSNLNDPNLVTVSDIIIDSNDPQAEVIEFLPAKEMSSDTFANYRYPFACSDGNAPPFEYQGIPSFSSEINKPENFATSQQAERCLMAPKIADSVTLNAGALVLGKELLKAAYEGRAADAVELLRTGADVNFTFGSRWTPLHRAAWGGHADLLALLAYSGANVNARTAYGFTALHIAAYKDPSAKCVKVLIEVGADLNARNKLGWTALHYAAESGWRQTVCALVKAGANTTIRSNRGKTAFHVAREPAIRKLLLKLICKESN